MTDKKTGRDKTLSTLLKDFKLKPRLSYCKGKPLPEMQPLVERLLERLHGKKKMKITLPQIGAQDYAAELHYQGYIVQYHHRASPQEKESYHVKVWKRQKCIVTFEWEQQPNFYSEQKQPHSSVYNTTDSRIAARWQRESV